VPVANLLELKSDFRAGYRIFQRTKGFDRKQRRIVTLSEKCWFRTLATEISDHQEIYLSQLVGLPDGDPSPAASL